MKAPEIIAAMKAGTPLAKKPRPHDTEPTVIRELGRVGSSWRCTLVLPGGSAYRDRLQSGSIWTLADAEDMCVRRKEEVVIRVAARERLWAQQIADRDAARAACKLIEPHAPSARVAEGRVELSPEDATKLACIAHASAELDKALAERNGAPS